MRVVSVLALLLVALFASAGGGCAGCSAQCSGDKQGSESCPCGSDQDCTTRLGTVLLCTDGVCTPGKPADAPGKACSGDADCGAGQACGVDGVCLAAPSCQRIDADAAPLSAHTEESVDAAPVTATRTDCVHTWQAEAGAASLAVDVSIDLAGAMSVTDKGSSPACTEGTWFAAQRLGAVACGATTWAVGPADVVQKACVGAQCDACGGTVLGRGVGLCP